MLPELGAVLTDIGKIDDARTVLADAATQAEAIGMPRVAAAARIERMMLWLHAGEPGNWSEAALTLTAALGALALTGGDATLEQSSHVTLTADSGQITLAGSDADLVTSGNITLDAEAGTLTLAGADAELETAGGEPEEPPFEAGGGTPFSRKAWDRLKKKRAEEKRGVIDIAASVQADYAYTTGRMRHVLRLVHTVTDIPAPIKLTKRQSRQRQQEEELLFGLLD